LLGHHIPLLSEQVATAAQVMAQTMQLLEILQHLVVVLLYQLCPQAVAVDVIILLVVNQIVAVEVAVVDQVGTAALKPFKMEQQVLLGKDIQADLGCIITELQQEHIMAAVGEVAQAPLEVVQGSGQAHELADEQQG
jgi:hypothetical protein